MNQRGPLEMRKSMDPTPASLGGIVPSTLMAFTAGFVDTASFVALFGLFAAHVTGNFVLIGASLAVPHPGILGKLLAFPVFLIAVAATRLFLHRCEREHRDATAPLLIGQIAFLVLFLVVGVLASPVAKADAPVAILAGMLGVIAMAIQNAASRTVFSESAPTTVMTGNVTQIVMDLVDFSLGAASASVRARLRKMIPAVLGFTLGAFAGGLGIIWLGFWCIALPILALIIVLTTRTPIDRPATTTA
jgi:uncharacterized membrane protein YoaK (UPF0700 family)